MHSEATMRRSLSSRSNSKDETSGRRRGLTRMSGTLGEESHLSFPQPGEDLTLADLIDMEELLHQ